MSFVVVIDVSKWQFAHEVPYEELKAHGVLLVFIKASMGGGYDKECDAHVEAARAAGLLVGLYHWCDPIQSWERQAQYFIDKIRKHNPDYICYDVEQWWDDWDDWANGTAGYLSVDQVTGNFRTIYKKVFKDTSFPYDRTFMYSADWFVNIYGSKLITCLKEFPGRNWWADYTQLWLDDWKVSWETWDWIWETWLKDKDPIRPDGLDWDIWQVQSRLIVPPVHDIRLRLDTNRCSALFTAELEALVGNGEPDPDPDPDPDPEPWPDGAIKKISVTAGALNIRKGPHVSNPKAGPAMPFGTEVYVYEIVNSTWGRIESDACVWTHLGYTQDV
jgi:hypothetical protein